jgi:hypothetical protein
MRYQAVRLQDRRDTVRMVLLGVVVGLSMFTFLVFIATTNGFFVDSSEQSAFNTCVTEQFAASRAAGSQFSWSQVQVDCTNRAINLSSNRLR